MVDYNADKRRTQTYSKDGKEECKEIQKMERKEVNVNGECIVYSKKW